MISVHSLKTLFIIPLILAGILACGKKDSTDNNSGPTQRGEDVIISESEMGQGKWVLTTKTADYYDEDQNVKLTSPKLINKNDGKEESSIKANTGVYDFNKNLITMSGNVVGVSLSEGAIVKTQELYYNTQTRDVWTDSPVTLKRGGVTVTGEAMQANGDFSEIELYKQKTQLPKEFRDFNKGPVTL